jgi:hypothetical protein
MPSPLHHARHTFRGFVLRGQELRFVEVVVPVVLRTLQGQLACMTVLGDLVHPHARLNHSCSRVRSARRPCLGRGAPVPACRIYQQQICAPMLKNGASQPTSGLKQLF